MSAFRKHTEANPACHGAPSAPAGLVFSSPSPLSMETSFLFQCSSLAIPSTLGSANPPSVSSPEITILHKLFNGGGSCSSLTERCAVFPPKPAFFSRGPHQYEQVVCSGSASLARLEAVIHPHLPAGAVQDQPRKRMSLQFQEA